MDGAMLNKALIQFSVDGWGCVPSLLFTWGQTMVGGFPGSSDGKASAYNVGDPGSIPGLGRSPGEGNGNPLQYSWLENSMDRGAWWATVHGVAKSRTRLSNFTFKLWSRASLVAQRLKRLPGMWETWVRSLGWEDPLEKEIATHSSILAWRIPWREEPGRVQSMRSQRVGHD